ncbi:MAG: PadR family transcriptional regulator [Caldilineaceae bacterium]|nr:PadR family transcriptional regulator [Caldilineaceae bacterium]
MSLKHAMLGFLSWQPHSGYDLKKQIGASYTHHWSGNNNQIYRTLVELHNEGLVTREIEHQDDSPSRKIYTITDAGRAELKAWAMSQPDLPEWKIPFLVQLAWTHDLNAEEMDALLAAYAEQLRMEVLMLREQVHRGTSAPDRSARESFIWHQMATHWLALYENELVWIRSLQGELHTQTKSEEDET